MRFLSTQRLPSSQSVPASTSCSSSAPQRCVMLSLKAWPKPDGAVVVDAGHDVTLRREGLGVPAVVPVVAGAGVRAAVDVVHHRVLLLGVEARWVDEPHLHVVAFGAPRGTATLDPHLLDLAQCEAGHQAVVEGLDAPRRARPQAGRAAAPGCRALSCSVTSVPAALSKPLTQPPAPPPRRAGRAGQSATGGAACCSAANSTAWPSSSQCSGACTSWSHSALTVSQSPLSRSQHGQLVGMVCLHGLVAGGEGDARAAGAVARVAEVPGPFVGQHAHLAAAQVHLGQCKAAVAALLGRGVVGKHHAAAVGRDVELVGVGLGPAQFEGRAFKQVAHLAGAPSLPRSSTCRCGSRPMGRLRSQWRYCDSLVT
jgi:hypothetical protein